jgi:hypothetical protein
VADLSWADQENWEAAWQPVIDQIGNEFSGGEVTVAADDIEKGLVRRYLEPLEFDCPLHYDEAVAKAHGYPGIIAPYSGLATWTSAAVWEPGDPPVYTTAERNAPPAFYRGGGLAKGLPMPPVNAAFATDVEYEYIRPFVVGDRLSMHGRTLLSCLPKETSVGRGAFINVESEVRNQHGELIAISRLGLYCYVARRV